MALLLAAPVWRRRGHGGRSQSPSSVSQQQNSSQTSEQNQSETGNKTLMSDIVSGATKLTYAETELKSTEKQKKTKTWLTEGDSVTLICEVNSSSTGWTFSWFTETFSSGVSPPVSLIISPNRTQHFTYVSVSLSCEDQTSGSQTGSTCKINSTSTLDTGLYWCESESGEESHPVNITVHSDVILESPVHPVTEGDTLTLHCLYQHTTTPNLRADFYKDESLIQSQTTEMIISNVSRSHEGFYYCKHPERGESPKSWISVTVFHSESQISVLHILSSVLAVSPYLLVTVVLIFKCCRMRVYYALLSGQESGQE
ncbi:Sialoadhesin [Labeo rohita]|uniref:Sialoadhesin n=1 Tax=Labeo rohita TaxID=84645 RepID=A0ABQ8LJK1_LABRO|nr:Sialoadhesin [Labeo rohita]